LGEKEKRREAGMTPYVHKLVAATVAGHRPK